MAPPKIAYLSKGRLHVFDGDGPARVVESRFGLAVRDRAVRASHRNDWKSQGRGAQFMSGGALWGMPRQDPAAMRIAVTSLTRAREPNRLLYALETDEVAGLFAVDVGSGEEQRLFHGNDLRLQHPAASPEADLVACSVPQASGIANLAVLQSDGSDLLEVTEGDSLDLAPAWVPGQPRLVYQSAGLGRDRSGNFQGYGPFALHRLDLRSSETEVVAQAPDAEFLGPRVGADGTVWAIRRPWREPRGPSLGRFLLDALLFPWRLLSAVFQWLNFFTVRYTGKPLANSGDARQKAADMERMMVWGNLIDAGQEARKSRARGDDAPALVPQSWQLVRIRPGAAPESVAKGVLAFDLGRDGEVVWSNGSAVFRLQADGSAQRLAKDDQIEQVVAL